MIHEILAPETCKARTLRLRVSSLKRKNNSDPRVTEGNVPPGTVCLVRSTGLERMIALSVFSSDMAAESTLRV